jgi:hypothetical protein
MQALSDPPPYMAFFPIDGKVPTKDSPSAPHSKTVADFYEAGVTANPQQDYPLSPLETASTEKKSVKPKIATEQKLAHDAPLPPTREGMHDTPPPPPPPNYPFVFSETLPTPDDSCEPCKQINLAPLPNVSKKQPTWGRPLRLCEFSGRRARPGFGRFGAFGLAGFARWKVKRDFPVFPNQKCRKGSPCLVGNKLFQ